MKKTLLPQGEHSQFSGGSLSSAFAFLVIPTVSLLWQPALRAVTRHTRAASEAVYTEIKNIRHHHEAAFSQALSFLPGTSLSAPIISLAW
jgi:ABC-type phosphate transport system permease subunit